MDPFISKIPNRQFYGGALQDGPGLGQKWPAPCYREREVGMSVLPYRQPAVNGRE
jgi:hypothetical protein